MVVFNYYLVWAGQTIEGYNPIMGMEFEIPIGLLLLVICAGLSYLLVRCFTKETKGGEI